MRVGIVGLGYWGPHYKRIFKQMRDVSRVSVFDQDMDRTNQACKIDDEGFPDVWPCVSYEELLSTSDAIVIATPVSTHEDLLNRALQAGKHVLCEKPVVLSEYQHKLYEGLAIGKDVILYPGLTFLHHPVVQHIYFHYIVGDHDLGRPVYFRSERTNFGPIRRDVNALEDLSPHDLTMGCLFFGEPKLSSRFDYLALGEVPKGSIQSGAGYMQVNFWKSDSEMVRGHIVTSWLEPNKRRLFRIVFEHGMVEYDDTDSAHPLREYRYSDGSSRIIDVQRDIEPLTLQCQAFVQAIRNKQRPHQALQISRWISRILGEIV